MKPTPLIAVAAFMALSACADSMAVTGRADNDMLRFSAKNYVVSQDVAASVR